MEINYELSDVEAVTKQLVKNIKTKTLLFYGNMGVGKTTLIKALVKALGSNDDVSSPTLSIVNEYELENDKIYHFDLYRIKNIDEVYNFGFEDYLDSNHWVFIEWPQIIEPILTDDFDEIYLELDTKNNRKLTLNNLKKTKLKQ